MTMAAMRHWPLPDTHNIRDLGGYATSAGATQWGRILRGEAPHTLSPDSVDLLVNSGLSLVIDLRSTHETSLTPHPFRDHGSVAYANIALFDALAPIAMLDRPFDMAQRYRDGLDKCGPRMAEVFRTISAAPPGMALVHCTAGKDRTGIVAALLLALAGVSHDDIVADYVLTTSAVDLIHALRASAVTNGADLDHVDRVLASEAATMVALLAHLDAAFGGVNAYLETIGLTADETRAVAGRLCAV